MTVDAAYAAGNHRPLPDAQPQISAFQEWTVCFPIPEAPDLPEGDERL